MSRGASQRQQPISRARQWEIGSYTEFAQKVHEQKEYLNSSRPTAVNLFWALARMRSLIRQSAELLPPELADALLALAHEILADDVRINRAMGAHGGETAAGAETHQ